MTELVAYALQKRHPRLPCPYDSNQQELANASLFHTILFSAQKLAILPLVHPSKNMASSSLQNSCSEECKKDGKPYAYMYNRTLPKMAELSSVDIPSS